MDFVVFSIDGYFFFCGLSFDEWLNINLELCKVMMI